MTQLTQLDIHHIGFLAPDGSELRPFPERFADLEILKTLYRWIIEEKIHANAKEVLSRARRTGELPRNVAMDIAHERLRSAMRFRKTY
jgi:hypothetical protein